MKNLKLDTSLMELPGMQTAITMATSLEDFMRTHNIRELAGVKLRFPVWAEVAGREITDGDRWGFLMAALANEEGPEHRMMEQLGADLAEEPESVDTLVLMVDTAILRLANSELVTQGEFTSDTSGWKGVQA